MSQKNDETTAIAMVMAFAGAAVLMFFAVIVAIAAFTTFVLTILCLLSWNKPLRIARIVFMPHESRAFVLFGLSGSLLVPAFILFASLFLNIHINWNYLPHIMLGGYMLGSLGIFMILGQQTQDAASAAEYTPPHTQLPAPPQRALPRSQPDKFRFASWDDEESQRNWEDEDDQE